ncbi:MAG TPA: MFS transporter [Chloroflexi bacterium]|nr:MFS transporter [Chloroflexota bacterium]
MTTRRSPIRIDTSILSGNLLILATTVFLVAFGEGLFRGASTNFLVDTLNLDGNQVMWLEGIREIPGLGLMFIAALLVRLPLTYRAAGSLLLMGIGYGLYALTNSYTTLIAVALLSSLGFHNWTPLQGSLAMSLTTRERSGRVMGSMTSVMSLATIVGMGIIALTTRIFHNMSLRTFYVAGGSLIVLAAVLLLRLPKNVGSTAARPPRLLIKRRYWLYYVLILFQGARTQVFHAFGALVLVSYYHMDVSNVSLFLLVGAVVNLLGTPILGSLIDRYSERVVLSIGYATLALCFVGYATIHNPWVLGVLLIIINLLLTLQMGLSTYVNRIAPKEELTPTLTTGVSVNHITSVGGSLLVGTLLSSVGYEKLFLAAAIIVLCSIPFALAMRVEKSTLAQEPATASAE